MTWSLSPHRKWFLIGLRSYLRHKGFWKFEMISTSTGSCSLRRDRIQLARQCRNFLEFSLNFHDEGAKPTRSVGWSTVLQSKERWQWCLLWFLHQSASFHHSKRPSMELDATGFSTWSSLWCRPQATTWADPPDSHGIKCCHQLSMPKLDFKFWQS